MQKSKQRTKGRASARGTPRAALSARQSGAGAPRRGAGSSGRQIAGYAQQGISSMPSMFTSSFSQSVSPKFGQAAPHEDYPDGGCRLSGSIRRASAVTTVGSPYLFGTASSICVSPQAALCATYTISGQAASTFLPTVSTYFRQWICRYLRVRWVPAVGTDSTTWDGVKSISMAYDMDAPVQSVAYTTTVTTALLGGNRNINFAPSLPTELVAIPRQPASRDDELNWITGSADSLAGTTAPAEVRTIFQGGVFVIGTTPTTGNVELGGVWIDYEFDLYGFTQLPSLTNATFTSNMLQAERKLLSSLAAGAREADSSGTAPMESKGDQKSLSQSVKSRTSDEEFELVRLKSELQPTSLRAQGREAGSKDETGGWFRKA